MINFGKWVVKHKIAILVIGILLLIPAALGYFKTRINYDILTYLPKDIETMKGQEILVDEFGTGAFSVCVVEGMSDKDISKMRKEMEKVPNVKAVLWYDSLVDLSIPKELLPDEITEIFLNKDTDSTILFVLFPTSISSDETMNAIGDLRKVRYMFL